MHFMTPFWCLVPVMTLITLTWERRRLCTKKFNVVQSEVVLFLRFCSRILIFNNVMMVKTYQVKRKENKSCIIFLRFFMQ